MSKGKSNRNNTPRRKRFKRAQRLESARRWLPTYEGHKLFKAYRKRYGVDWATAFTELEMLGVKVDPAHKERVLRMVAQQAEQKRQKRLARAVEQEGVFGIDQDEHFAFIVGYTSGGAPYGITWEEWEALDGSESDE